MIQSIELRKWPYCRKRLYYRERLYFWKQPYFLKGLYYLVFGLGISYLGGCGSHRFDLPHQDSETKPSPSTPAAVPTPIASPQPASPSSSRLSVPDYAKLIQLSLVPEATEEGRK